MPSTPRPGRRTRQPTSAADIGAATVTALLSLPDVRWGWDLAAYACDPYYGVPPYAAHSADYDPAIRLSGMDRDVRQFRRRVLRGR